MVCISLPSTRKKKKSFRGGGKMDKNKMYTHVLSLENKNQGSNKREREKEEEEVNDPGARQYNIPP